MQTDAVSVWIAPRIACLELTMPWMAKPVKTELDGLSMMRAEVHGRDASREAGR